MAECTFTPKTTRMPSYLAHRASDPLGQGEAGPAAGLQRAPSLGPDPQACGAAEPAAPIVAGAAAATAGAAEPSAAASAAASAPAPAVGDGERGSGATAREQMERELAELQRQWRALQEARATPAVQS
jgi:hypothetical protein